MVKRMFGKNKRLRLLLCCLIFLGFISSILLNTKPIQAIDDFGSIEAVELTVLVDNYPNGTLQNPWGFSMLIETSNYTILFDTGSDPNALGNNSIALGKDLSTVDYVVISHEHWDHTYGLEYVAEINPGVTVYIPSYMATMVKTEIINLSFNVVEIHPTTILSPGIAIIGELWGPPYEQALALNIANVGAVIIVGCSHPGVENHVERAVTALEVDPYLVIGGFHMTAASESEIAATTTALIELGVEHIYPTHCCGDEIRDYISENYPNYYGEGCVGTHLVIDQSLATAENPVNILTIVLTIIIMPIVYKWIQSKKRRD